VNDQNPMAIFINGYVPLPADGSSRPGTQVHGLQVYVNGTLASNLTYQGVGAHGEQNWSFPASLKGGGTTTEYVSVDEAAGTVSFAPQAPAKLAGTPQDPQVVADYIPGSLRLTTSGAGATGSVGFTTSTYEPSWYWNTLVSRSPSVKPPAAPIAAKADRLWAVWQRAGSGTTLGPTLYYKSFRPGLQIVHPLITLGRPSDFYTFDVKPIQPPSGTPAGATLPKLQDVDVQKGVLFFGQEAEGWKVAVTVTAASGQQVTEVHYIGWREEGGETPVPMDVAINEGSVSAFPVLDLQSFVSPDQLGGQPQTVPHLSKIWLFWTSTRGSGSDIFHATIAPRLTPLPG
jgi:hypothetical protein